MFLPRAVPHAWSVDSETARFLVLNSPAGFERSVLEFSSPAPSLTLPPDAGPPDQATFDALLARERVLGVIYE